MTEQTPPETPDSRQDAEPSPPKCECPDPDHRCTNDAADHGVDVSPALCTPCLYGCMP